MFITVQASVWQLHRNRRKKGDRPFHYLKVSVSIGSNLSGDPDTRTPVCNTGTKLINGCCLVETSEPSPVVRSPRGIITLDVFFVLLAHLGDSLLDVLVPSCFSHLNRTVGERRVKWGWV